MNYYASDVALRNNKENGFWIILDNLVYDVSRFVDSHPGGNIILMNNSGRDATDDFMKVQHHENTHIIASLRKFYIGRLCQVKFEQKKINNIYKQWLENSFLIVEMQNTLFNDLSLIYKASTHNENLLEVTPYKIDILLETHNRFVNSYLDLIFLKINSLKKNLINKEHHIFFKNIIIDVNVIKNSIALIRKENVTIRGMGTKYQLSWHDKMLAYREFIERNNTKLLSDIKYEMLSGLKLFEFGDIGKDYGQLASSLNSIETAIINYSKKVEIETQNLDFFKK